MLLAFDWVAAEVSLVGAAWFALAALEASLLGVCVLDCQAGAAEDAAFVESIELAVFDGLIADVLPGLLAAELGLPLGVDALDWFMAEVSVEPLGALAAEDGEVVLPTGPVLLAAVQ